MSAISAAVGVRACVRVFLSVCVSVSVCVCMCACVCECGYVRMLTLPCVNEFVFGPKCLAYDCTFVLYVQIFIYIQCYKL